MPTDTGDTPSLMRRLADSRFSPVTILSDEDYKNILHGKLARVEAQIAAIDVDLAKMKRDAQAAEQEQP